MKKLYKSAKDKKISGVLGGLGEYLNFDATWLRLAWCAITLCSFGFGIIAYIIAAIVIPEAPKDEPKQFNEHI